MYINVTHTIITHTHIQVREAYSKWWYNKKRKSQFFNRTYFTKPTSFQTSVSYNNFIIITSYFLQNDVKHSERIVPAVNNSGQYTLGTFDGMYGCIYVQLVMIYCSLLESTSDTLKKLKNTEQRHETELAI